MKDLLKKYKFIFIGLIIIFGLSLIKIPINNVYYRGLFGIYCKFPYDSGRHEGFRRIKNANQFTFEVLSDSYAKDYDNVFYGDYSFGPWNVIILKYVDPDKFEAIGKNYGIYEDKVYITDKILEGADSKKFRYLGGCYATDESNVWCNGSKIDFNVDIKTFKVFKNEDHYAKDKSRVYDGSILWIDYNVDVDTFELFKHPSYAKDKNNVYIRLFHSYSEQESFIIDDADPKTFEMIEGGLYSKDKNFVYLEGKKIIDADPKTFEVIEYGYSKDKNNVYYLNQALSGLDVKTFKVISKDYVKDKDNTFCQNRKIIDSDSDTFEIIMNNVNSEESSYAKDKNNVYFCVLGDYFVIAGADPATFKLLAGNIYTKDKNKVYFYGREVKNADSKTFKVFFYPYAKDKNNCYNGEKIAPMSECEK